MRVLPFEVLAQQSYTGNLETIDEHKESFARYYPMRKGKEIEVSFGGRATIELPWVIMNKFEPIALRVQMLFRRTQRYDNSNNNALLPCLNNPKFYHDTAKRTYPIVKIRIDKRVIDDYDENGDTCDASARLIANPPRYDTKEETQQMLKLIREDALAQWKEERKFQAAMDGAASESSADPDSNYF